jgi:PAS domain S-box-containing protein
MPDETEHKRAEKAIKELGNYLHQIINRIGDPVFVKDQQLRFVLVNDALCAILGKTREEIIGTTGWEYLPKEEMAVFRKQDNLVLETGEENLNEENLTYAEGKAHRIHTKKTLYTDNDGNKFLIGVIRDITERKRAELLQNAVYQISRAAEKATGLDDLFRGVHKIVSTVMEAGNFYISLYDKGKGVLTFPYFVDEVDTSLEARKRINGIRPPHGGVPSVR